MMVLDPPGGLRTKIMVKKYFKKSFFGISIIVLVLFVVAYVLGFYKIFLITSDSMYPAIKKQSLVVVWSKARVKEKDVISFKSFFNTVVTHRVVAIDKSQNTSNFLITTKGDNNNFEDAKRVLSKDVIGKAILVIPNIGFVFSPIVFGFVFYIPFGVLVGRLAKKVMLSSKHGKKLVQ